MRSGIGHRSNQAAQRFLVSSVCQRSEVAGKLQQQSFLRRRLDRLIVTQTFEKEINVNNERLRNCVETASRYPVNALLVFLCLLSGDANRFGQLLLIQPEKDTPLAYPRANVTINILRARTRSVCSIII